MRSTYTFAEIIDLIENATQKEISAICGLISEERKTYSPFQLHIIGAAVNMYADSIYNKGLSEESIKATRTKNS